MLEMNAVVLKDMVAWKMGNRRVMELRLKATKKTFRTHELVWMDALVKGLGLPADTEKVKVVKDNDGRRFLYSMDVELDADGVKDTIVKGLEALEAEAKAKKEAEEAAAKAAARKAGKGSKKAAQTKR